MNEDIKRLLKLIYSDEPIDLASCAACQGRLYAYIETELDSLDAAARFSAIASHLAICPDCLEEYEELRTLFLMDRRGEMVEPPSTPIFDLSFLSQKHGFRSIWHSAGRGVSRLISGITIRIGREIASFDQLPTIFTPQLINMPAMRRDKRSFWNEAQKLSLVTGQDDLAISLLIGPVSDTEASLSVLTSQTSTGQTIDRARITIRDNRRQILLSELTRESGLVTFPHIESGEYLLEVKYHGRIWELPVTVALLGEDPS
jgi:hypothetical protein